MNTSNHSKKDKFDESIDKDIKIYVDSLTFEEDPLHNHLLTPQMQRAKVTEELKESIKLPIVGDFLDNAYKFIKTDGLRYLDNHAFDSLTSEIQHSYEILDEFDSSVEVPVKFRDLLEISDEAMDFLYVIAKGAFKEERYQDSLSVFFLLTTLDQTNSEYWLRLGVAAQTLGDIDLALNAYSICFDIDPALIEARLFSAECHFMQDNQESAMREIDAAKKIIETSEIDPIWLDFLATLEKKEESLK